MEEVNWGFWIKCDAWTLREAILLLEGREPEGAEPPYSDFFYRIERLAIRSNRARKLLSIDGRPFLKSTIEKSVSGDRRGTALGQGAQNIIAEAVVRNQRILSGIYEDDVVHLQKKEIISSEAESIGVDPRIFLEWAVGNDCRINENLSGLLDVSVNERIGKKKYKDSVFDMHRCEAIACCLWDEKPKRTIKEIIEHPWIRQYGNGAQYHEKTIRKWIHKLDPRPEQERIGRPEKGSSESSGEKPPSET